MKVLPRQPRRLFATAPLALGLALVVPGAADPLGRAPVRPGFVETSAILGGSSGAGLLQGTEEPAGEDGRPRRRGDPQDLTELSLEELMELEITTINVLGSHTHLRNQWMVAYRYMAMDMAGYRDGTRRVSNAAVLQRFPTLHTSMFMEMHMLEAMYAPSDRWTVMAMVPFMNMSMDHLMRDGSRFTTHSSGLGDFTLMSLYTLRGDPRARGHRLLLNTGISFPTGSINQRDDTPVMRGQKLEYMMQTGSGTFDLMPGFTYLGESAHWAWGAQTLGTLRLGRNANDYRFGHRGRLTTWGSYKLTDWAAPSVRLDGQLWGNVRGMDPELNPLANPEANPRLQGGRRVDFLLGMHFFAPRGTFKGTRLSIEGGVPIYQSLIGPQIETDWQINVGVSHTFR
jgi:hypothetical protein